MNISDDWPERDRKEPKGESFQAKGSGHDETPESMIFVIMHQRCNPLRRGISQVNDGDAGLYQIFASFIILLFCPFQRRV